MVRDWCFGVFPLRFMSLSSHQSENGTMTKRLQKLPCVPKCIISRRRLFDGHQMVDRVCAQWQGRLLPEQGGNRVAEPHRE
jgi:type IV secretory pathway protease TraF